VQDPTSIAVVLAGVLSGLVNPEPVALGRPRALQAPARPAPSSPKPSAPTPTPSLEELEQQLREPKPEKRRAAVRALVRLGRADAWRLVFAALGDADSGVADEAQLALAGLLDAKLWRELQGRAGLESKDERVAARVAEALGRAQAGCEADELAKLLGAGDSARKRLLAWSAERLARDGRLTGDTERLQAALARSASSSSDVGASCAALVALAELRGPTALRLALDALRSNSSERRSAALLALVELQATEAFAAAVKLSADPDARVRLQAFDALDALGTQAAFLALVARLGAEPQLRLRWRIVDVLQSASGLKHRLDPRPWKLWIETLPTEGPIRVAYLFDFSGSMWTPLADGRIPKDIVSDKLRAALEALPPETEFNLIPFTNVPLPWREHAEPASPKNVRAALEFFLACRERGKGNFLDAALLAANDPRIDTICVLTDGVPTGGTHSDMDLIAPLLLEATRFRRVVVDSILVDAPGPAVRRWAELSRRTGGRSLVVELKPTQTEGK
jgi:HEAT repeat protein